jgi:ParB/RepB/Spo0J family partition protein
MNAQLQTPLVDVFLNVPLAELHESPTNPRKQFDAAGLKEMAASIREHGVLMPLLVRRHPSIPGHLEVVAGARRLRAAQLAGIAEVPARIKDLDDKAVLEVQVIENLQRQDIHPLEEADGYQALHQKHGYSIEDLAAKVGKSKAYIYARLKLCALVPDARKAFLEGKLSSSVALLLARIPAPELQAKATGEVLEDQDNWTPGGPEPMSFRRAAQHIQEEYMLALRGAPFNTTDAQLVPAAGSCNACPKRTGNQKELFSDVARADVCTDPPCFNQKRDAAWLQISERARKDGARVIPEGESKKLFPHGTQLAYGTKYVDLDATCYDDPKHRSWQQLLGDGGPPISIARDQDGCARKLVEADAAREVLKKKHPEIAKVAARSDREEGRGNYAAEQKAREQKAKRETRIRTEAVAAIVEHAGRVSELDLEDLRLIAAGFFADVWHEHRKRVLSLVGVEGGTGDMTKAFNAWLRSRPRTQLNQALLALALIKESYVHPYNGGGKPELLTAAAKRHQVDVDAIRKRVIADVKAKASPKKGKAAASVPGDWNRCRECSCTDDKACATGCSWTEKPKKGKPGLCSACVAKDATRKARAKKAQSVKTA